jgi:hypothetical protein
VVPTVPAVPGAVPTVATVPAVPMVRLIPRPESTPEPVRRSGVTLVVGTTRLVLDTDFDPGTLLTALQVVAAHVGGAR